MLPISEPSPQEQQNLAALIMAQADASPDAIAIIDEQAWSYSDLMERVNRHAASLAHLGLAPEATVGVIARRNADLVALLLALLCSGAAYVPIDPDDPPERAVRLLGAAECSHILGDPDLLRGLRDAAGGRHLPPMTDIADLTAGAGRAVPSACAPGGARLAYVLYTSGSTGEPKGVEVEHRQLVNLLTAARDLLEFRAQDRSLAVATLAFDTSVVELFLPLMVGGSVLLRDRSLLRDPRRLCDEVEAHGVTVVQLGPSSWALLLEEAVPPPRLRVAISTGEAIAPRLAEQVADCADVAWNLYGPTETTVWCTGFRLEQRKVGTPLVASVPIGTPLRGYEAFVLEQDGSVSSDAAEGELMIAGVGLARGYRSRPDLTKAAFPCLGLYGARMYHTGDLVRRDVDGVLHYLGRIDDQVKVGGVRVEPREIEAALLECREIKAAAATWHETAIGHRGIVAAVVWGAGVPPTFEALHARLGQTLPRAMRPSRYLAMETLPLTTSGKVDRGAIRGAPAQEMCDADPEFAHERSMTDTEAQLSLIWKSVLGLEQVDTHTHFFTAGGDSLSAIRMVLDAEKVFDTQLDHNAIWNAPRLSDFARAVEIARPQPDDLLHTKTVFPVVPSGNGPPLFFSNIDLRLARAGLWRVGCPLYAIVQWRVGQGFVKADSIMDLATLQMAEIRQVQPSGPYRIGGYSMGGLIALEIARLLRGAGEEVELLFLLDPMAPDRYRPRAGDRVVDTPGREPQSGGPSTAQKLARLVTSPSYGTMASLARRAETLVRQRVLNPGHYHLVDLHGRRPSALTRRLLPKNRWPAFWHAAGKLARDHVVHPYDGDVLAVFHDRKERYEIWRSLLPETAGFSVVDTTHLGLFSDPCMGDWMRELEAVLCDTSNGRDVPSGDAVVSRPENVTS